MNEFVNQNSMKKMPYGLFMFTPVTYKGTEIYLIHTMVTYGVILKNS